MKRLSYRQEQILSFIREFVETQPYPPTIRDIQAACNISSTSVVDYNLRILQKEGHIHREAEVSRGIELVVSSDKNQSLSKTVRVPVFGNIAAGEPLQIPSSDSWNTEAVDEVDLPAFLTKGKEDVFAVRVKGDSMIDALVADGDLVLMESVSEPQNGDMVAAWLNNTEEVTLKHFHMSNGVVTLQPANPNVDPITVPAESVLVQGRVVGIVRTV